MQNTQAIHQSHGFDVAPLDQVEAVLEERNWVFSRVGSEELMLKITGRGCDYSLFFIWHENMSALQLCCQFNLMIPQTNNDVTTTTLSDLNDKSFMGHFGISSDTGTPAYRCTHLARSDDADGALIAHMIDIALSECERAMPAFKMLSTALTPDAHSMSLALMDTCGES